MSEESHPKISGFERMSPVASSLLVITPIPLAVGFYLFGKTQGTTFVAWANNTNDMEGVTLRWLIATGPNIGMWTGALFMAAICICDWVFTKSKWKRFWDISKTVLSGLIFALCIVQVSGFHSALRYIAESNPHEIPTGANRGATPGIESINTQALKGCPNRRVIIHRRGLAQARALQDKPPVTHLQSPVF